MSAILFLDDFARDKIVDYIEDQVVLNNNAINFRMTKKNNVDYIHDNQIWDGLMNLHGADLII